MNWLNANSLRESLFTLSLMLILLFASIVRAGAKEAAIEEAFVQAMLNNEITCPGSYGGHQQGMATDRKTAIFWSHTLALAKTDLKGNLLKVIDVPNHYGDLDYHDGKVYVAANFGDFNQEGGKRDSWIYVYDADDLSLVDKHPVNEVEYGAGGIAYHNGRFIVVGGLPDTHQKNYLYEYDENFHFIKRHVLDTGYTAAGIQTAAYHNGYWWFGCYGMPDNPGLLQTDESFNLVHTYDLDFGYGIIGLTGETLLAGGGRGSATVTHLTPSDLFKRKALTIAENGQSLAVIVAASDAPDPQQHAAQELANFLKQITGAVFKIVDVNQVTPGKVRLLVGPKAARLADPDFTTEGLGLEGIVIRTVQNDLILAGGSPRGTLYAVYTFLEDQLGCRWWTFKVSTIPSKAVIRIDPLNITYVPLLEYRESEWAGAFDGDWAVRNKFNGNFCRLDAKRGGKHTYDSFVHTFHHLISPKKHFKDHPEWFPEIDGKRQHQDRQLCLTNEAMRRELVKNLKQKLRANPAATIAEVSQMDHNGGYCQCDKCAAIDADEGSHAGSLLHFINAIAVDIEDEFPHVAVSTLAYQYTRKPPKIVKPRHNVIVRLCPIECDFGVPLTHERNKDFRDDIIGWSKICDRLFIWDYVTNFRHIFRPHPNLRVLGPNIRFYIDHGVTGIFENGISRVHGAEMSELRAWVQAKRFWNPALDDQTLLDEFLDGYYGPAGKHISKYIDVVHDAIEISGDYLGCLPQYTDPDPGYLSFEILNKGWQHLQAAQDAVAADSELLNRVQMAQLPVMYSFMRQWKTLKKQATDAAVVWPLSENIDDVYDHFLTIAKRNRVDRLNAWDKGFGLLDEALKNAKK